MTDEQTPDLDALAQRVIDRLEALQTESDAFNEELTDLFARIYAAIVDDDISVQLELVDEIREWLGEESKLREDIRNALQLFYYYVSLRNGIGDGADLASG